MSAVIAFDRSLEPPPQERLHATWERLRTAHRAEPYPSLATRRDWLDRVRRLLVQRQDDFAAAISADFGHRSRHETLLAEVFLPLEAIREARQHLAAWMRPERRRVGLPFLPGRARVERQPLGVVGVIAPWNYPVQLAILPLVGALSAGNRVLLKPSELTPRTSALLAETLPCFLGDDVVAVVLGDARVGAELASLPLDHLLFTGSTHVGRQVMQAAAPHLTPLTLELGGKSPALVLPDYPIEHAAKRIAIGKLWNAGQTCIAPDYVLAPRGRLPELASALERAAARAYPAYATNPDYTSILSDRHLERLRGYLRDALRKGARAVELSSPGAPPRAGSAADLPRRLAPTLLLDVTDDMIVMQEEIFGPLLPLVPYDRWEDAVRYIDDRPRPLALYVFDRDERRVEELTRRTTSGGVTVNDTLLHVAQDDLPFGGVGPSGMGAYHGLEGFQTFSHSKAVFHQARWNGASLLAPPYGRLADRLLSVLLR